MSILINDESNVDSECGIYGIKNLVNGKIYVGQSVQITHRMRQHLHNACTMDDKNTHLYNAMRLYGIESFEWFILENCSKDVLNERESFWINELDSTDREKGYNIKFYDDRNTENFPQETKDKISKALTGKPKSPEHIANMPTKFSKDYLPSKEVIAKRIESIRRRHADPNYVSKNTGNVPWNKGLTTPYETREKQRLAKLGKKQSQEHIDARTKGRENKVYQFDLDGTLIKIWNSAKTIEEETNTQYLRAGINGCCNGNKYYYFDSIFRYEKDILDKTNPTIPDAELSLIQEKKRSARKTIQKFRPTRNIFIKI